MKISIILPAYNEEARLPSCLDELLSYLPTLDIQYEIIVSADGCSDDTEKIASKYASAHKNVLLVSFPERLGKGGGILNAARAASGDVLIMMDVDLATPPIQIPVTVRRMEEEQADIVYGSRNMQESNILVRPPLYRKILGKAFNFLFRLLFDIDLHDTQCGFKAIRRDVFNSFQRELNIEGFAYDMDLAVKAVRHGYKILELPITWSHVEGSKVNTLRQIFEMGRDLLIVWLEGKKREVKERVDLGKFYNSVPGDVYFKASKSWFLPRRWWHSRKNKTILDAVPPESIEVLDAGFGSGTLFEGLQKQGKHVYGIDIGEDFLRFAHMEYGGSVGIVRSDVGKMPFRDSVFDCITCSEVLEHVPDPAEAIEEMGRILRTGGTALITTPHISLRWSLIEAVWTHVRREIIEIAHVAFTRRRLRYYLLLSGFRVVEDRVFLFGCLTFVAAKKITSDCIE